MEIIENKEFCSIHFSSLLDLIELDYNGRNANGFYKYLMGTSRENESWLGKGSSCNRDIIKNALLGNKKIMPNLNSMISQIGEGNIETYSQKIVKRKRRRVRGEFGDELDIHRVNSGELDKAYSSRKHVEVEKSEHLVTLMIDVGGRGDQNAEDSMWRAAVAVKLTDQLISAGKSVQIIVGSCCGSLYGREKREHTTTITVKRYDEPLSLERLAAMSHLGFHRTFNFAARCAFNKNSLCSRMGESTNSLKYSPPATMEKEIMGGHTKYVYLARALSIYDAKMSLREAYSQMKSFSKVEN